MDVDEDTAVATYILAETATATSPSRSRASLASTSTSTSTLSVPAHEEGDSGLFHREEGDSESRAFHREGNSESFSREEGYYAYEQPFDPDSYEKEEERDTDAIFPGEIWQAEWTELKAWWDNDTSDPEFIEVDDSDSDSVGETSNTNTNSFVGAGRQRQRQARVVPLDRHGMPDLRKLAIVNWRLERLSMQDQDQDQDEDED
ncbi:hypothetical protein A1O3_04430 [Capronia epimyces CBS 606.96]|uniref:Uncharacterized protein n=1 Tax=Capronia epimyces CBS 606.96 TaxID=1182542 RepID=W9YCT9_9EURO|nr:uncharacterized protein A1O3_04430 [Capronia epimyces CBS 606.96]EXJ87470.1 hypothetical protein A1O3_04430 [Capronia epimyces CBS 606.96]